MAEEHTLRSGRAKKDSLKITEQLASIDMESSAVPSCLLMHPLGPTCTIADDRGTLRIWDYRTGQILNRFAAGMPGRGGGGVASLSLVNDLDDGLLLAGGEDGAVRVWRNYTVRGEERLVTALRALPLGPAASGSAPSGNTGGGFGHGGGYTAFGSGSGGGGGGGYGGGYAGSCYTGQGQQQQQMAPGGGSEFDSSSRGEFGGASGSGSGGGGGVGENQGTGGVAAGGRLSTSAGAGQPGTSAGSAHSLSSMIRGRPPPSRRQSAESSTGARAGHLRSRSVVVWQQQVSKPQRLNP